MKNRIKMQTQNEITVEEGFERWMLNCKRRGLTENTINYYHTVSEIFMQNIHYTTELSLISSDVIDKLILKLQETGIKNTSINTYLNGIRSVCNWWASQEYIKPFKIDKIKCDEEIKETFVTEDIKILLKKPNIKKCTFLQYECWVLCNVFYGLGARASTIVELTIGDLDLENGYIIYRKVKDRKQTIIPMTNTLISILQEYLDYRKGNTTDCLFVHSFGGKLSVDRLNHIMNNYYRSKGVTKTGVHRWRHTYAKDYIVAGGSALKLQAQLCHKTLDMTKKYVSLYGKDIRDDEHNPLELMNKNNHMKMKK